MHKSIFTLEDFDIGSILYWVFPVSPNDDKSSICYDKFEVVGSGHDSLMIQCLDSLRIENLEQDEIETIRPNNIIIPEYIYNHIHNLPNPELTEKQKIQLLFLTGHTEMDLVVKKATESSSDYWLNHQESQASEGYHD